MLPYRLHLNPSASPCLRSVRLNLRNHALIPALASPRRLFSITTPHGFTINRVPSKKVQPNKLFKKRYDSRTDSASHVPEFVRKLLPLQNAIAAGDIKAILEAYVDVRDSVKLGGADVSDMAVALHAALRNRLSADKKDLKLPPEFTALADLLVADIQAYQLPPNHSSHIHLLKFYRESLLFDKGIAFWTWLRAQDLSFASPAVYAAAIELLAVHGRPAEETENLFVEVLKRFPGSFNEYHLSPNALLPDRDQPFAVKGVPTTTLRAIITARLLRGDARSAYLGLDTALRLIPTGTAARFLSIFIEERPVSEAYKVFMMACRAGTILPAGCLRTLLHKMRLVAAVDPLERASVMRSMITVLYAYTAIRDVDIHGSLSGNHLTEFTVVITSIFKDLHVQAMPKDELDPLVDQVMLLIRKFLDIMARQGSRPTVSTFNTIITNIGKNTRREDVLTNCMRAMEALGVEPTLVTHRSMLIAIGHMDNPDLLRSAWLALLRSAKPGEAVQEYNNWNSLFIAAKAMGREDFARSELERYDWLNKAMVEQLNSRFPQDGTESPAAESPDGQDETESSVPISYHGETVSPVAVAPNQGTSAKAKACIHQLLSDVDYMDEQLSSAEPRNFYINPLPMSMAGQGLELDEQQSRQLYNELTADPSIRRTEQAQAQIHHTYAEGDVLDSATPAGPAMSYTGFSYAELRFQNWKTINELLIESEKGDRDHVAAVRAAMSSGADSTERALAWTPVAASKSIGLSDLDSGRKSPSIATGESIDIRTEVRRLRGI